MKHSISITIILVALFLVSHVIGLLVIKHYLPESSELPLGIQKPQLESNTSFIPIFIMIIVATIIALFLMKFEAMRLWKFWFLISVFVTLVVSFSSFLNSIIAIIAAVIFAIWKTFKPNIYIHNFTELFIYGGLAAIFVPVLSPISIIILLVLISIYDMIAVWKTKHMVSMAKFQTKSKMFVGLLVPYKKTKENKKIKSEKVSEAILGGGDIAFPLMLSGVVLKTFGFIPALIISLSASLGLILILILAKKGKFYPAMPFISAACFIGYFIVFLSF